MLADVLYSGLYWETSQTADSGIILNNWWNKESKVYLREENTHLVFPVSQHKLCRFIAGSHQFCPSSCPSLVSVPRQPYHLPPTHQNLLFIQKASHYCISRHFVNTVLFFSPCAMSLLLSRLISRIAQSLSTEVGAAYIKAVSTSPLITQEFWEIRAAFGNKNKLTLIKESTFSWRLFIYLVCLWKKKV